MHNEQAQWAAAIYLAISVLFSALSVLFSIAIFQAPLYAIAAPFLGAMLFICLAAASGYAAVYCARRI